MRKKAFYILIIFFIIQLIVPASMIGHSLVLQKVIETKGSIYYIEIDPIMGVDDGKIYFRIFNEEKIDDEFKSTYFMEKGYMYAQIDAKPDGTAYLHDISYTKPKSDNYIKSLNPSYWVFPKQFYLTDIDTGKAMGEYIDSKKYTKSYFDYDDPDDMNRKYPDIITARIAVYKGQVIVKGIEINGTEIEEYFKNNKA